MACLVLCKVSLANSTPPCGQTQIHPPRLTRVFLSALNHYRQFLALPPTIHPRNRRSPRAWQRASNSDRKPRRYSEGETFQTSRRPQRRRAPSSPVRRTRPSRPAGVRRHFASSSRPLRVRQRRAPPRRAGRRGRTLWCPCFRRLHVVSFSGALREPRI